MTFLQVYFSTLKDIVTDRSGVLMLMLSILIYSIFYPIAYWHQVTLEVPLAVVDLDNSVLSRKLVMAAAATQGAKLVTMAGSLDEGRRDLESGRVEALLWIGPGFERDVLRGRRGAISLFGNGAYLIRARSGMTALAGAVGKAAEDAVRLSLPAQGAPATSPIALNVHPLFNTRDGYASAVVPAVMALVVQQTQLIGIGLMLATWRPRYGRKMTPAWLAARFAAFVTIAVVALSYFTGVEFWQQDYPRGGNPGAFVLVTLLYAVTVVSLGLFIGSFFRRREQAGQFFLVTSLPMFFLIGSSWPQTTVTPILIWLSKCIPVTPGANLVIAIEQMGATLRETANDWLLLGVQALIFGTAAVIRLCSFRPAASGATRGAFPDAA